MRQRMVWGAAAAAVVGIILGSIVMYAASRRLTDDTRIYVPHGSGRGRVTTLIASSQAGISSRWVGGMLLLRALTGRHIHPGFYSLGPDTTVWRLTGRLTTGRCDTLTVREGMTQREIAAALTEALARGDDPYLDGLRRLQPNFEGRLFPATYRLNVRRPRVLVERMRTTFERKTAELPVDEDILILASIIQMEGARRSEFERISGVFHNRLRHDMKLESDPTLQYVVGKIRLTKSVLKNPSPYNSYLHKGLPPTPICNPGLAAIRAALDPETHEYFYFVSKRNGYHYFSPTKWEHFQAVGYYQYGYDNGFIPEPSQADGERPRHLPE